MVAIGIDLDVGCARLAGMGNVGCFHGYSQAWAIIIVAVDSGDTVLLVDGGGAWEGHIRGLTLVVRVRCMPSRAFGATRCAENN